MLAPRTRALAWFLLAALASASAAAWLGPALYIQPFRAQTSHGLDLALTVRELAPSLTLAAAAGCLALSAMLWRGTARWWRRLALIAAPALALVAAGLTRWNHFESMFAPLAGPQFASASEAEFVEKDDIVLAVVIGGEAAAYPVRQMAYHHVVQDDVGGVPIVATY